MASHLNGGEPWPRVLAVHNRYRLAGGEDIVFEQEVALLRARGHHVATLVRTNDEVPDNGLGARLTLLADTVWSRRTYRDLRAAIRRERPHVVHVHNFLPLVSPASYHAAWAEGVPVVQTLHNYRLVCVGATLRRSGRVCESCVGRSAWGGALHGCYRGSRQASLAVAGMLEVHRGLGTWRRVQAYVAVSEFVRRTLVRGGLAPERVHVKPNFVPDVGPRRQGVGSYALFAGRLSPEKGVRTLLRAWGGADGGGPLDLPLRVAGTGPLEGELHNLAAQSGAAVELMGHRARAEVQALLADARLLVYPSEWHEPMGIAVAEALAAGVPVLVSRMGALPDLVAAGETGEHFTAGDAADLARAARRLAGDPAANARMGGAARRAYEAHYTPERNYDQLLAIYRRAEGLMAGAPTASTIAT